LDHCPSNLPVTGQSFARVEVLSGPERRRRWSREEKASIVAESLGAGAVARQVALRHGVHPNQLYAWRREAAEACGSARPVVAPDGVAAMRAGATDSGVEIALSGAVIRVPPGVDMQFLRAVLGAVKQA
jgi:transposase